MDANYLSYFLPEEILERFNVVNVEEKSGTSGEKAGLYISLMEKNLLPEGYDSSEYESKGYYPAKQIQDFPIRGKAVYLLISRRRWRQKENKSPDIHSDLSFIANDVKLTKELADFLKSTGHDPRRYS